LLSVPFQVIDGITMTNLTEQTAAGQYAQRSTECQDLLTRIASRLERHQKEQAQQPGDWVYTGDLDRVSERFAEILATLGDRSACEAKGIKY
jgi:hypothetical protein